MWRVDTALVPRLGTHMHNDCVYCIEPCSSVSLLFVSPHLLASSISCHSPHLGNHFVFASGYTLRTAQHYLISVLPVNPHCSVLFILFAISATFPHLSPHTAHPPCIKKIREKETHARTRGYSVCCFFRFHQLVRVTKSLLLVILVFALTLSARLILRLSFLLCVLKLCSL